MRLELSTPLHILVDEPVAKVSAEGVSGDFTLLPNHVDMLSILAPGILTYTDEQGQARYLAVDDGVLVKAGETVHVATQHAVQQADLHSLQQAVAEEFEQQDAAEIQTRAALHKLEADVVREFRHLEQHRHG